MKRKEKFQRYFSKVQLFVLQIFLTTTIYSQADKLPTTEDAASIKKGFPIILQQVPLNFGKIKTGNSTDFFGSMSYASSVKLMPSQAALIPQNIFFMTEKNGKSFNVYTETLPYSVETIVTLLTPMLKQNNMIEVMPQRSDSTKLVRSFRNSNAVLELTEIPDKSGTTILIGKPYYYYTADVKPITAKSTNQTVAKFTRTKANNNGEDRILKELTKLYKAAINKPGSFEEYKSGAPDKQNLVDIYNLEGKLQLDSIQKAFLFVSKAQEGISGASFEITAAATPLYISTLNKMAGMPETFGEVKTEKKFEVTRYSLYSKALNKEIISLLDFNAPMYSDRLICNTIYAN